MNSQKGITLVSLIVYIIGITIVISILGSLITFFYKNVISVNISGKDAVQYAKFNMFFLEDLKEDKNSIISISKNGVTFSNGNSYVFQDNRIYRNNIKICENVGNIEFTKDEENDILQLLFSFKEDLTPPIKTVYSLKYK